MNFINLLKSKGSRIVFILGCIGYVLGREAVKENEDEIIGGGATEAREQSPVLGIDLGTTYSVVSAYTPSKASVEIISYGLGRNTLPSFIKMEVMKETPPEHTLKEMEAKEEEYKNYSHFFYKGFWMKKGTRKMIRPVVGWEAVESIKNEKHTVANYFYRFKPLMARNFKEPTDKAVIKETISQVKYSLSDRVEPGTTRRVIGIDIRDEGVDIAWTTPRDLSTMVLSTLRDTVNKVLNSNEKRKCVVTVPAYFNDQQKMETRLAAAYANLEVLDEGIINEPTSAAVAYTYLCAKKSSLANLEEKEFLVFDWGGGTIDLSYLAFQEKTLDVMAHAGDNFLGGENVNDRLYNYFVSQMVHQGVIKSPSDLDINSTLRLRHLVEDMKIKLCDEQNVIDSKLRENAKKEQTKVTYEGTENNAEQRRKFFISDAQGKIELVLNTQRMNELCDDLFQSIRALIFNKATAENGKSDGILNKIKKTQDKVENILYVGGSSRIPGVRRLLMEIFENANHCFDLDADTCVSVGAAYHAAANENLINEKDYIALIDALPMNMGIRLDQDMFDVMAKAGDKVPNSFAKTFATTADGQKSVQIEIGQTSTETKKFSNTKIVGNFKLDMPQNNLPRGQKLIQVTFDFGSGGDIEVTAKELGEEKENTQKIIIKKEDTRMDDKELEKMNAAYEKNREEEDIWFAKCGAVRKFEDMLLEIHHAVSRLPKDSSKREELNNLHEENKYWIKTKNENHDKLSDQQLLDEVQEKEEEVRKAFLAISESAEEEGAKPAEEEKEEAEEYVPREDL
ncbi:heat shock 70kDa protein 1/2/6/8 [Nematocida sp. AWRm77]|nr:heat shock 70kDa protein 1/2/6/8 [Nematocida sp. AWRm77]